MQAIDFKKSDESIIAREIAGRLKVVDGKLYFDKKKIKITLYGKPGEPGKTPVKGVDYKDGDPGEPGKNARPPKHRWNGTELQFQNPDGSWGKAVDLKGEPGYTPQKNKDYFDGRPGKTPVKGIDYKEPEDGDPGKTPRKGIDYFDGKNGLPPAHQWEGASIRFMNPDGTWGDYVDLKGTKGDPGRKPRAGIDYEVKDGEDGLDAPIPKTERIVILDDVNLIVGPNGKAALEKKYQPIDIVVK